jgi:hypothetical protein
MKGVACDHTDKQQPHLEEQDHSRDEGDRDAQRLLDFAEPKRQRSLRRRRRRSRLAVSRV